MLALPALIRGYLLTSVLLAVDWTFIYEITSCEFIILTAGNKLCGARAMMDEVHTPQRGPPAPPYTGSFLLLCPSIHSQLTQLQLSTL